MISVNFYGLFCTMSSLLNASLSYVWHWFAYFIGYSECYKRVKMSACIEGNQRVQISDIRTCTSDKQLNTDEKI